MFRDRRQEGVALNVDGAHPIEAQALVVLGDDEIVGDPRILEVDALRVLDRNPHDRDASALHDRIVLDHDADDGRLALAIPQVDEIAVVRFRVVPRAGVVKIVAPDRDVVATAADCHRTEIMDFVAFDQHRIGILHHHRPAAAANVVAHEGDVLRAVEIDSVAVGKSGKGPAGGFLGFEIGIADRHPVTKRQQERLDVVIGVARLRGPRHGQPVQHHAGALGERDGGKPRRIGRIGFERQPRLAAEAQRAVVATAKGDDGTRLGRSDGGVEFGGVGHVRGHGHRIGLRGWNRLRLRRRNGFRDGIRDGLRIVFGDERLEVGKQIGHIKLHLIMRSPRFQGSPHQG